MTRRSPSSQQARPADGGAPAQRGVVLHLGPASVPACTAVLGTSAIGGVLINGVVPPDSPLVWPLVVLALGSMAYDLGVRALRRDQPR